MVERAYPVTYMIALGIILLLSYIFVRQTVGFSDPIDRSYLPFFFLGSGFMLVETKAVTELGLHLGGTWFVIAAAIMLVLVMAYLANLIVTRTGLRLVGPAYLGLFVSLLVGYGLATSHEHWMFGPPQLQLAAELPRADDPAVFFRDRLLQPDWKSGNQYLHGVRLQSDGRVVRRRHGI